MYAMGPGMATREQFEGCKIDIIHGDGVGKCGVSEAIAEPFANACFPGQTLIRGTAVAM